MNTKVLLQNICDNNETNQLHLQFVWLFKRVLNALTQQLVEQLKSHILQKCKLSTQKSYKVLGQIIELLVSRLVHRIQAQKSLIDMDIIKSDYQALEFSLQKAQAQIRGLFKIQHQQQITLSEMEEKLDEKSITLQQANKTITFLKTTVESYEKQRREIIKKLDHYKQKFYSIHRQNRYDSAQKSTQKILHKASLQFKHKNKLQPYFQNLSKSKQIIFRRKQTSKLFKDTRKLSPNQDSKLLSFQTLKDKHQTYQTSVQNNQNCSISFQSKNKQADSLSELKSAMLMQEKANKPKNRVLRNLTQAADK